MRRIFRYVLIVLGFCGAVAWWLSAPEDLGPARTALIRSNVPDVARGEAVFHAAGCAACHAADGWVEGEQGPVLAGGQRLETAHGVFVTPNISPDPTHGIGAWGIEEFATAMLLGVSPEGQHYYPAFPYTAYAKMRFQDIAHLWAYLQSLPASDRPNVPHELALPYAVRRGVGLWKRRYLSDDWVAAAPSQTLARGRYLVEALGHCAECHTPRDRFGGLNTARWMAGAPHPAGGERRPNITPAALDWSAAEIAYFLETGFTPDQERARGAMARVVEGLAELTAEDRAAIAAYVRGLAPIGPK
ncbi:MAG: cytochrome c [Pseudomonadota bacterium]